MSHLQQNEIELILNWIEASDNLKDLRATGIKGWLGTPESNAEMEAQHALHKYGDKTGRRIASLCGLYAGNVWD